MFYKYLLVFCALLINSWSCDEFLNGNEFYLKSKYADALKFYQTCLDKGDISFGLYYNLGNTYFKLGNWGKSRLFYEKARNIEPGNRDLLFNLKILDDKLSDEEDKNFNSIREFNFVSHFTYSLVLGFLVVIFGIFRRKSFALVGFWLCLIVFSLHLFFILKHLNFKTCYGVVLSKEVELFSNKNRDSTIVSKLHEGKLVKIEDKNGDWAMVSAGSSLKGWLPLSEIGQI